MELTDRRVLVTGGAGFLGRRVCALLRERGVAELSIPRRRTHDLTEQEAVRALVRETRPDTIIHLAAEVGGIGANQTNPGRYFYANMAMGLHLVEAAREAGIDKFVQVGTVCSYPKHTPAPFREVDLWNGYPEETNAPYGIAKKALLVMLHSYRQQYGLNGIYLLPVNLYGPGDNFDPVTSHVVPALIRKLVEARDTGLDTVEVWGTGAATREFLYVDDAARGIVAATEHYDGEEPVNLGSGEEVSIASLVTLLVELTGYEGTIVWNRDKPDGQPRRLLDTDRARRWFAFSAQVRLREGLERTIAWWEAARQAPAAPRSTAG